MRFEYFNGRDPVADSYMNIPKCFNSDPVLNHVSINARYVYGMMLDRMKVSAMNNMVDKEGKTYIYYDWEEIAKATNISKNTVYKVFDELDTVNGVGLIERVKMGQGRQSRIYVMRIVEAERDTSLDEYETQIREKAQKIKTWDSSKNEQVSECQELRTGETEGETGVTLSGTREYQDLGSINKNNINKNNYNNNLIHIYPSKTASQRIDGMGYDTDEISARLYVREDMGTDHICELYPAKAEKTRELENLIVDVLTTKRPRIHVGGEEREANIVKGQFMKLRQFHLETVLGNWSNLKKAPQNPRAYLLTMLYNAVGTAHMQFEAEFNEGAQNNHQHVTDYEKYDYDEYMEG